MASKDSSPRPRERDPRARSLGTGIVFDKKIVPPYKVLPGDPYRWLIDPLHRPDEGRLICAYKDCTSRIHISTRDWQRESYIEYRTGNAPGLHIARVFLSRWFFVRVFDSYYAFCPDHHRFWKGYNLAETILQILQYDRAEVLTSDERDDLIRRASLFDYRRDEFLVLVASRLLPK